MNHHPSTTREIVRLLMRHDRSAQHRLMAQAVDYLRGAAEVDIQSITDFLLLPESERLPIARREELLGGVVRMLKDS